MNQKDISYQQKMFHLVERWEQSGISLRAFSKANAIPYEKLRYWKKKFKGTDQNPRQKSLVSLEDIKGFIPVAPQCKADVLPSLQITYPNQVELSCPPDIGLDTLKSLIKLF